MTLNALHCPSSTIRFFAALVATVTLVSPHAHAADVKLFASAAIKPAIDVLGPQFERASGHKLDAKFELTPAVKSQIEAGETFDVAIANPPHIADLTRQGKIAGGTGVDIARFGVGVGVRSGTRKPDVGSVDALRQTLLNAKSIAYVGEGTSGVFVRNLLEKLKIAAEVTPKLKPGSIPANVAAVAQGETEIVMMPVPVIMASLGVELAGPVPNELQDHIAMTAGLSPKASEGAPVLVKFLMGAEATVVLGAKGYERVAP